MGSTEYARAMLGNKVQLKFMYHVTLAQRRLWLWFVQQVLSNHVSVSSNRCSSFSSLLGLKSGFESPDLERPGRLPRSNVHLPGVWAGWSLHGPSTGPHPSLLLLLHLSYPMTLEPVREKEMVKERVML